MPGHGAKIGRKQELAIAALLSPVYRNHEQAAAAAGISKRTLANWLQRPEFQKALRQARRQLREVTANRFQAGDKLVLDKLLVLVANAKKDSDALKACAVWLNNSCRRWIDAEAVHGDQQAGDTSPMNAGDVQNLLAVWLRRLDEAELPTAEKIRLLGPLALSWTKLWEEHEFEAKLQAIEARQAQIDKEKQNSHRPSGSGRYGPRR
jgi:hypothetical protein